MEIRADADHSDSQLFEPILRFARWALLFAYLSTLVDAMFTIKMKNLFCLQRGTIWTGWFPGYHRYFPGQRSYVKVDGRRQLKPNDMFMAAGAGIISSVLYFFGHCLDNMFANHFLALPTFQSFFSKLDHMHAFPPTASNLTSYSNILSKVIAVPLAIGKLHFFYPKCSVFKPGTFKTI